MSFKSIHRNNLLCKLGCEDAIVLPTYSHGDSMNTHCGLTNVPHSSIYKSEEEQKAAVSVFMQRQDRRASLLADMG